MQSEAEERLSRFAKMIVGSEKLTFYGCENGTRRRGNTPGGRYMRG